MAPDRSFRLACIVAWAVALALLLFQQAPLLFHSAPLLSRDDQALVLPLRAVHGLRQYLALLGQHALLDVQPVRDLSFWLDLKASAALGHPTFHWTNLLLLLAVLACAQALWISRAGKVRASCVVLVLLAAHPAIANTVSWIAARKHLLAALFILIATLLLERPRPGVRRSVLAGLAFLASLFSQPITLLWPLWLAFDRGLHPGLRKGFVRAVPYFLLAAPVAAINLAYYRGAYTAGGALKFVPLSAGTATTSLLAIGRYVFNGLCPIAIATEYDPGRIFNLIGLLILPLALWASCKRLGLGKALPAWGFFVFPLATVTLRMTNIFVSDTYLLVPLIGLGWLATELLATVDARAEVPVTAGAGVLALAMVFYARTVAASWRSDEAVWDHAYRTEPTPNALAKESFYLANAHRYAEAREIAMRLLAWDPGHSEAPQVYARAVYQDPSLTPAQKYQAIAGCPVQDAWTRYFRASLDARGGDFGHAYAELLPDADDASRLGTDVSTIAAEAQFLCERAQGKDCATLPVRFRHSARRGWSTERYLERARQLGISPSPLP